MLMLTGEYELSIDEKYRLSIPARVREATGEMEASGGFYVIPHKHWLDLYTEEYFQRLALAVAPRMAAPDESLAFDRVHFALASKVELDRQGRVLLGEKAVRRACLTEQVTLIGARDHLEVWDRVQWELHADERLDSQEQYLLQARMEVLRQEREAAGR